MRSLRPHSSAVGKINVTPLIDVVMCLIIFYLIVGRLATDRLSKVQLPSTHVGTPPESREGLIINVAESADGASIVVDAKEIDPPRLDELLQARAAVGSSVQIRADRRLPYGKVQPVLDACRKAGLTSVKLTTRRGGT